MKKYVNGHYIEMTPEEVATIQEEAKHMEEVMKSMPPTAEERLAAMEAAMIALMGVI